jgi:predicted NUDIX family NTP pyrophosphohydrolase
MKQAAGTLLYRQSPAGIEILLVHASGNYNRHKPWSIPKGLVDEGETLEQAARRETWEEAGIHAGDLRPLKSITYRKSRKEVHAFAGPAPAEVPHPASWEIDRVEFVSLDKARQILHPDQLPLLDRLEALLAGSAPE